VEFGQARRTQKMIRLARTAGNLIEQEDDEDGCKIKTTF
jgi:hypothetical protein